MNLTSQQKATVAVLLAGTFLAVLNQTLLTPALPTIMSHLDVSATTAQWLTSGYSLVEAVIVPLNAYLLGRFSTRRLYIGGIGIFAVGSIACACAPGFPFLMAGRVMQAVATGIALPTVFTLILLVFPRESRGSAMGLIGLILSFAPALGPSISGVLVDTIGWRALFVLVAAIAIVVIAVSLKVLRNFEGFERTTFDVTSVVIGAIGMVCLLYGLSTFSSAAESSVAGCHIAFGGLLVLALIIALVFVFCVRDEKTAGEPAERGAEGAPGIDRPWLVSDVMNARPAALPEHATVGEAIALMQETETSGLPIVSSDGTVAGFVSDGDILKAVSEHRYSKADADGYRVLLEAEDVRERLGDVFGLEAAELGTRRAACVGAGDDAEGAFRTLAERRIKKVPVTRDGKFAGTLSRRNIMRALATMEGAISEEH